MNWIKLSTNLFDDEKIKIIETLPEHDSILIIWIKILALAGKTNNAGCLMLDSNIPYTDEMLSTIFMRPINTIRLALSTFEKFGMIEIHNRIIIISKWKNHQVEFNESKQLRSQRNHRYYLNKKISDASELDVVSDASNVLRSSYGKTELRRKIEAKASCKTLLEEDIDIDNKENIKEKVEDFIPKKEDFILTSEPVEKEVKEHIYRKFDHLSITVAENKKLIELGYNQEQIDNIYDAIENNKNNKTYKKLYATAKNWLSRIPKTSEQLKQEKERQEQNRKIKEDEETIRQANNIFLNVIKENPNAFKFEIDSNWRGNNE